MALVAAALVFAAVVTAMVVVWWMIETRRRIGDRLKVTYSSAPGILRSRPRDSGSLLGAMLRLTPAHERLSILLRQAGRNESPTTLVWIVGAFALVGGGACWLRTGQAAVLFVAPLLAGVLPFLYLLYQRQQRLKRFRVQFPDALDTMTRALRTGYALGGAIQLVGDEMPDPVGPEFKQVSEEIRLGMDPTAAMVRLRDRVPTEDLEFFCRAILVQQSTGGNLAEILDHLSEVIRERFKLLSHIRALSAQHKWSAVCVGLSPLLFAMVFQVLNPSYFDPLWASPLAPYLLGAGGVMEAIGFLMVWRIARIEV